MFLIGGLYDVLRFIGSVFRNAGDNVPRPNIPLIGGLLDWIGDRIHDVGDTLYEIARQFRDMANWFELVHDIVQYIIDFVDIEDWLKDLWQIPELSIGWIGLKSLDVLKWMLATSEDFSSEIVHLLLPALKKVSELIDMNKTGLAWTIGAVVDKIIAPGTDLMIKIISNAWLSISGAGAVLEDWIIAKADWFVNDALDLPMWLFHQFIDSADWIINEGLRLGDWIRDEIDNAADWVTNLLDKAFWQMLDFMVNMPDTFVNIALGALENTFEVFAERILSLAESILDYVWGEE